MCNSGKLIPHLPARPDLAYQGKGWKSWRDILGVFELEYVKGKTCHWCGPDVPAVDLVLDRPACGKCLESWCAGNELVGRGDRHTCP